MTDSVRQLYFVYLPGLTTLGWDIPIDANHQVNLTDSEAAWFRDQGIIGTVPLDQLTDAARELIKQYSGGVARLPASVSVDVAEVATAVDTVVSGDGWNAAQDEVASALDATSAQLAKNPTIHETANAQDTCSATVRAVVVQKEGTNSFDQSSSS
jgi:hypothetical protein